MRNINDIRSDFPILNRKVYNKPLIYFDNGATTQKPDVVLRKVDEVYKLFNANIHRGVHYLSDMASEEYEGAREKVRAFINAPVKEEIIFTSGTTGSINTVAFSFGEKYIKPGDEIVISHLEHHANIVPWQMVCERKGATLKVIPINEKGEILFNEYLKLLSDKTKIVAVSQASNALGTLLPVKRIIDEAHKHNIPVFIDGAQGVQHGLIDVKDLDCDFYAFSGHKIYGPAGIGVLYGKSKYLENMPPYQGGGDMVENVTFEKTTYNRLPFKFEAGTMNYPAAIGMGAALDYINSIGISYITDRESNLLRYATDKLSAIEGLKIYGTSESKIATLSFLLKGIHQYDTGSVLDKLGIAVRTGTHCAQPVMDYFGIAGTVRASMCFYNTEEEIDALCDGLLRVNKMFLS